MALTVGTLRGLHGHFLARRYVQAVWLLTALLITANIVLAAIRFGFDIEPTGVFAVAYYRLHLTSEANVAAWYSGLLMFVYAMLLSVIALAEWRSVSRWWPHGPPCRPHSC